MRSSGSYAAGRRQGGCGAGLRSRPASRPPLWTAALSGPEARGQRLSVAGEQAHIGAHRGEAGAGGDVAAGQLLARGEDAGMLAGLPDPRDRLLDGADHLRMALLSEMAPAGGEVAGADEHAV